MICQSLFFASVDLHHLLHIDRELLIFLNNLGSQQWDSLWLIISNKWTSLPLYFLTATLLFVKFDKRKALVAMIALLLLFAFTSQMTQLVKHFFERPRPCRTQGLLEQLRIVYPICGQYGFWSAHACNSFGFAIAAGLILRKIYKNLIFLLLIWAAVVAYSRIYLGVHYPLDIICGACFGIVAGTVFHRIYSGLIGRISPCSDIIR